MARKGALPVRGDIQAATPEGFAKLITKANEVYDDGLMLVGIVNLSSKGKEALGAVYVRLPQKPAASLVGE